MTPNEYFDACKAVLTIESDYALARELGISKQAMSQYRKGDRHPDDYAAVKIAITLGLDPSKVLADLKAQSETDPKRAAFWRDFLSRASAPQKIARTLALIFTCGWFAAIGNPSPVAPGGFFRRWKDA